MSVSFILETVEDIISDVIEREDLFWKLIENSVKEGVTIKRKSLPKVINGERETSQKIWPQR